MRNHIAAAYVFGVLAMPLCHAQNYAEGEVWSYKTRANEKRSTLLINKIEESKLGPIYHISIRDISIKNPHVPSGVTNELPHIPVVKQTLDASCIKVVGHSKPHPGYLQRYTKWKRRFVRGHAGVFTIPVSEIVDNIESTLNK